MKNKDYRIIKKDDAFHIQKRHLFFFWRPMKVVAHWNKETKKHMRVSNDPGWPNTSKSYEVISFYDLDNAEKYLYDTLNYNIETKYHCKNKYRIVFNFAPYAAETYWNIEMRSGLFPFRFYSKIKTIAGVTYSNGQTASRVLDYHDYRKFSNAEQSLFYNIKLWEENKKEIKYYTKDDLIVKNIIE